MDLGFPRVIISTELLQFSLSCPHTQSVRRPAFAQSLSIQTLPLTLSNTAVFFPLSVSTLLLLLDYIVSLEWLC